MMEAFLLAELMIYIFFPLWILKGRRPLQLYRCKHQVPWGKEKEFPSASAASLVLETEWIKSCARNPECKQELMSAPKGDGMAELFQALSAKTGLDLGIKETIPALFCYTQGKG